MGNTLCTISPLDRRNQAQVDALLHCGGIRRDAHLDYTCGLFDDDWQLIATGSCFRNTIRCLAVAPEHQGEGLLAEIVTHLNEVQIERGNSHVFLYTKPQSAKFFADIGYYEIARVQNLVFMENHKTGFSDWLGSLGAPADGISSAIVMNANPFTKGHRYLIETAAKESDCVHLFLLQEEAGPIPFAVRKQLVEAGISDLNNIRLHESGPYIISGATFPSYFLRDADDAIRAHAALDLALFSRIAPALHITRRYVGEEPTSRVTSLYNAIMREQLPVQGIECRVQQRLQIGGRTVSASTVRQAIHAGALDTVAEMLPLSTLDYFRSPAAAPVIAAIRAEKDVIHY